MTDKLRHVHITIKNQPFFQTTNKTS